MVQGVGAELRMLFGLAATLSCLTLLERDPCPIKNPSLFLHWAWRALLKLLKPNLFFSVVLNPLWFFLCFFCYPVHFLWYQSNEMKCSGSAELASLLDCFFSWNWECQPERSRSACCWGALRVRHQTGRHPFLLKMSSCSWPSLSEI